MARRHAQKGRYCVATGSGGLERRNRDILSAQAQDGQHPWNRVQDEHGRAYGSQLSVSEPWRRAGCKCAHGLGVDTQRMLRGHERRLLGRSMVSDGGASRLGAPARWRLLPVLYSMTGSTPTAHSGSALWQRLDGTPRDARHHCRKGALLQALCTPAGRDVGHRGRLGVAEEDPDSACTHRVPEKVRGGCGAGPHAEPGGRACKCIVQSGALQPGLPAMVAGIERSIVIAQRLTFRPSTRWAFRGVASSRVGDNAPVNPRYVTCTSSWMRAAPGSSLQPCNALRCDGGADALPCTATCARA